MKKIDNINFFWKMIHTEYIASVKDINRSLKKLAEDIGTFIKSKDLSGSVIYYSLPLWSYLAKKEGAWLDNPPIVPMRKDDQKYIDSFYDKIKNQDDSNCFSFTSFFAQKTSNVPLIFSIIINEEITASSFEAIDDNWSINIKKSVLTNEHLKSNFSDIFSDNKTDNISTNDIDGLYNLLRIYCLIFPEIAQIVVLPVVLYKDRIKHKDISYGGVIFACREIIKDLNFFKFVSIISTIKYREFAIDDWVKKSTRDSMCEAVKSAKAAIMSRNMSHNLGSHVMAYLKQRLNSVEDIVRQNALDNILKFDDKEIVHKLEELKSFLNTKEHQDHNIELPFLVGMGRFINYLQERQDYIATISTNHIPSCSTISFKDFIYDELKPDLRHKRHNDDKGDRRRGYKPQNILLDFIAASEGYEHSDKIKLCFGKFDGSNSDEITDFNRLRELNVSLPGGIVGRQAFFSVMENVIRNAAKHSIQRITKELRIVFDIIDFENKTDFGYSNLYPPSNLIIESINKNVKKDIYPIYESKKDKYHVLSITIEMDNPIDVIAKLGEGIASLYVNEETYTMDGSYKGIKEMRISAAWMRGYNIDTDIPKDEPPALFVRGIKPSKNATTCYIQYLICLPKPKQVVVVFEDISKELKAARKAKLNKYGWSVNFESKFRNDSADYELVLAENEDLMNRLMPYSPSRITFIEDLHLNKMKYLFDRSVLAPNKFEKKLKKITDTYYEKWLKENFTLENGQLPVVSIRDKKAYSNYQKQEKKNIPKGCLEIYNETDQKIPVGVDKIIYSTHFSSMLTESSKDEKYINAQFIEGVSGGNSTDRLLRHGTINNLWRLKHLGIALTKVAIFDERIFQSITPKNQKPDIDVVQIFKTWYGIDIDQPLNDDAIKTVLNLWNGNIYRDYQYDESKTVGNIELLMNKEFRTDVARSKNVKLYNVSEVEKFFERGVWVYDLIFDECQRTIKIVGYNRKPGDPLAAFDTLSITPEVTVVGTITCKNSKYQIEIYESQEFRQFDFLLIHQGLLDKIYRMFAITKDMDKIAFTKAFYSALSKHKPIHVPAINDKEMVYDYLPQFIIHSGRSKPVQSDMPQKQPFMQFAALENAVHDCKYTLVEQLLSAHYCEENLKK